jgi:hypothetical protein
MIHSELRQSLIDYGSDAIGTDAFVALWREKAGAMCAELPCAYRKALDDMLMRVESSRLFAGDSCSFSRESLLEVFGDWLEKATLRVSSQ